MDRFYKNKYCLCFFICNIWTFKIYFLDDSLLYIFLIEIQELLLKINQRGWKVIL
jgi:hypothetical protein